MAGLLTGLQQSARALEAQQLGLQVTGNNLANVNNTSYARESVVLGTPGVMETTAGEQSMGLEATGIQESRNSFLDAQVNSETAQTSTLQAQSTQLTLAQSYLDEQVSNNSSSSSISDPSQTTSGISSALDSFFNAFSALAASPSDSAAQQTVLQSGSTLANTLNTTYSQLQSLQGSITSQVNQNVGTVNGLLQNIASLNGQIEQYNVQSPNSSTSSANNLVDQRQADLQQLAGYMNFTTSAIPNSDGQIQVTTLDANSNPVTLVSKSTVEGGISFDGSQFSGGVPSTVLALTGGSLQGDVAASQGGIQQLMDNLSTTASQITTAVNDAYNPTKATGNFFASAPSSGSIISLDPSLSASTLKTTNTGDSGANELALAVSQIPNQTFSTSNGDLINGTIGGYYSQGVTSLGESIDGVQSQLSDQTAVQTMVQQQQQSVSGVNEDEELTNLMTYQNAYSAQADVINTLNSCLSTVISGLFGGAPSAT
jgi:flagellar hook-associated protein 1 FlgK